MSTDASRELIELRDRLREFARDRDWDQFHAPKNLAISLSLEASEVLEIFQWQKEGQQLDSEQLEHATEELADVLLYLIRLADKLDIDLVEAARGKIAVNATKYPIEKSRGSARKYTEL